MDKNQLKELVKEILNELSPQTLSRYTSKARGDAEDAKYSAFGIGKDVASDAERNAAYSRLQKRKKGIDAATGRLKKPGDKWTTDSGKEATKNSDGSITYRDPNAKKPSFGSRIKSAFGMKETAQRMDEGVNTSTGPIRLTSLLNESMMERRVNLTKVQTVMEKLYPELTTEQSKKLMELCTEAHVIASQLNMTPYIISTENSLAEWKLLVAAAQAKMNELKDEVVSICEKKKIDPTTVVKAIDEVFQH
jgi:hypothetical protein